MEPLPNRSYHVTALEGVLLGILLAVFAYMLGTMIGGR